MTADSSEVGTETIEGDPGLTSAAAEQRLAEVGPNTIAEPVQHRLPWRVAQQLRDPMILLLLAAAAITAVLGDLTDLAVISVVIVVNTAVGVTQEVRAEHAVAALRRLAAPTARVRRDGRTTAVAARELVPGDLVLIDAGDIVPADLDVAVAVRLQVDESALTGESVPVHKAAGCGVLHAGTVITQGRGEGVVTATGASSALGRIAAMIAAQPPRPTPLQHRLTALAKLLSVAVLVIGAIVVVAGVLRGESLAEMVVVAVSLAVAAVPESMPAVVALALALGAHRMAQRAAVVRELPAVETLGAVTVIASDKTGTLTEGKMRAEVVWTPTGRYGVIGAGYDPEGQLTSAGELVLAQPQELRRFLLDLVLCNDADLAPPDSEHRDWRPLGDPQEAALVTLAARAGIDVALARSRRPRVAEVPFDSTRRRMTTVHRTGDDRFISVCKGAPDVLLTLPGLVVDLPEQDRQDALGVARSLADAGYRVLAVADATRTGSPPPEPESGLLFRGLVAIADPLRDGAEQVAAVFRRAGVRLALITGDHPATASAIARQVGIEPATAVVGDELTGAGLTESAAGNVFARVSPGQKLDLIRAWQQRGDVVAMTGDGVNDAPALQAADIGVAMGRGGTEVARQAADLVLVDDNLATVAKAIEEGRRIYANVRRFLGYAMSGGFAEVLVMLVGPFLGVPIPLLPGQILWVNMLTHGLPGVAMGAEPAEPGTMREPPVPPTESVLGRGLWQQVLVVGALIAVVAIGAAAWVEARGGPWQSTVFVVLGLAQLGVALALRSRSGVHLWSRFLTVAVGVAVLAQVAPLYLPWLQDLLNVRPLAPLDLAIAALAAITPGLAVATARAITRRRSPAYADHRKARP